MYTCLVLFYSHLAVSSINLLVILLLVGGLSLVSLEDSNSFFDLALE